MFSGQEWPFSESWNRLLKRKKDGYCDDQSRYRRACKILRGSDRRANREKNSAGDRYISVIQKDSAFKASGNAGPRR